MREQLKHQGMNGVSFYEVAEEHGEFLICQWMGAGRPEDYDVYRLTSGNDRSWVEREDGTKYYYVYTTPHTLDGARQTILFKGGKLEDQNAPPEFTPFL